MKTIGKAKVALAIMMLVGGSTLAMAADSEKAAPEKGTWQYDYAMETGTLAPIGTGTFEGREATPATEKTAPEKGTWQYDYAMETGTLVPIGTGTIEGREATPAEETVEIGGMTYRIHIDLP